MITQLFESSDDDIKILHHIERNASSKKIHERGESPQKAAPKKAEVSDVKPDIKIPEDIKKEIDQVANDIKESDLALQLYDALTAEYQKVFSAVPTAIKTSIDTCFKEIESADKKEDLVIALEDLQQTITNSETLSFKKRQDIFRTILTSESFAEKAKDIGEKNGYKLEVSAFKSTGCYKQLSAAIEQVFNAITTVSFEGLKLDNNLVEASKNYFISVLKTPLNAENELKSDSDAFDKLLLNINPESKNKPKEKVNIESVVSSQMPKPLQTIIKRCWKSLNDVDKTVLSCYENDQPYSGYVTGDNLIAKNISSQMTPEGIVCLCGIAADKYFPAGEDSGDEEDITLELQKFTYKGGSSTAIIHYGQPKNKSKDSQFFEIRVDPAVKIKNEKGRAELVIRTFDDEDKSKFVTKRGKRVSVYETLKMLFNDEGGGGRRRR